MILKRISYTFFLLAINLIVSAQNIDAEKFKELFPLHSQHAPKRVKIKKSSEIQFTVSVLLKTYKRFLSSQDVASCAFEPSCSEFAVEAIQSVGFFKGTIMAADRLSRCNKFSPEHYQINEKNGLFIDPVKNHIHLHKNNTYQ